MKVRWFKLILSMLVISEFTGLSQVIYPNADVYVETSTSGTVTTTYDGQPLSSQIVFGLAAANGTSTGRRRSYLEFTISNTPVTSAKLRLYNYWGANMGGIGNPAGSATIRLLGTQVGTPVPFSEPASPEVTTFVPPLESNFTTIVSGQLVDTVGWHEFDITSWYNARLGQTTTLLVRGVATSGFDFPLFEDRENTAYNVGAANTIPDSGPQIVLNNTPEPPPAQQLAFPGAEGFGAYAKGGRGGDVYSVSNLNDSGPGSLRNGVTTANGPRTIVFSVSGNLALQSTLTINKPYITIAGQTAPGDGICIKDYSLNVANTHNVVVRGLRVRRGDVVVRATGRPEGSTGLDTVSIDDSSDVIFDHCSLSWSCDEIFGIVQNRNVSIQWCIISEPLGDPLSLIHPYGTNHAYGMNCSATTLSVHHNLIAKYVIRGPQFEANDASVSQGYEVWKEAVNNVLFDYRNSGSRYRTGVEVGAGNVPFRFHFIKNFYIRNPSRNGAQEIEALTNFGVTNTVKVHVSGNIGPGRPNDNLDQWTLVKLDDGDLPIRLASAAITNQMSDVPLFTPPVPVTQHSASNAYKQVISLAGYNQVRDAVDLRVISNVVNRQFFDFLQSQSQVGGWPALSTYNVPTDTDRDGMPDYWETALGKNPSAANHNATNSDGYTDLEHYLNWLMEPRAVVAANSFVDVNLRSYTQGMASNAAYTVSDPTNGAVMLLGDGRTARFTPSPNFFGRGSFRFVSTDTLAGGGMTNTVNVLVTPSNQPRFTVIHRSGGNVVLGGSGGLPLANYYLLTSTDVTAPAGNWSRVATNQFDVGGNFNLTNAVNVNAGQTFYRLQIP